MDAALAVDAGQLNGALHQEFLAALHPLLQGQAGRAQFGQARAHLGKPWAVEMVVRATGASRAKTRVFLNSEKDFRSERNLT